MPHMPKDKAIRTMLFLSGLLVLLLFATIVSQFATGTRETAAVAYWQTQTTSYNGYPSPGVTSPCIYSLQTSGEQDPYCYWNPLTAVLSAAPVGSASYGQYAYAYRYCTTGTASCTKYAVQNGASVPLVVAPNSRVQLNWACQPSQGAKLYSSTGALVSYATTTLTTTAAGTNFTASGMTGSTTITAGSSGTTSYTLTCSGGTGPYTATVPVVVEPISISADSNSIAYGSGTTIRWTSSGMQTGSCTISGPTGGPVQGNGAATPDSWTDISSPFITSTSTLSSSDSESTMVTVGNTDYMLGGATALIKLPYGARQPLTP